MTRTSLEAHNCSLARTVDVIGDKWALMIVRDAFYGVRTFSAFQSRLGVSKTVLSERLTRLCDAGILIRTPTRDNSERQDYLLSDAGRDLFPVVIGLVQWGDRWIFGPGHEPIRILDRETGSPVQPVVVQARSGRVLTAGDTGFAAGPGATAETLATFAAADGARRRSAISQAQSTDGENS